MLLRRALLVLLLAAILLGGGWTGYWYYAAGLARDGIARWTENRRAEGYTVDHGQIAISGYPLAIVAHLPQPAIAHPADGSGWRAGAVALEARVWNLRRIRIDVAGTQEVRLSGDPSARLSVAAAETAAVAQVGRDGKLARARLRLREAVIAVAGYPGETAAGEIWLAVERAETPPAGHRDPFGSLSLLVDRVLLPPQLRPPLGIEIANLRLEATLLGRISGGSAHEALTAWRDDGGTVEVRRLDLRWGPLDLHARGTAALDAEGRPLAAMSAEIRGHAAVVRALSAAAVVDDDTAALAEAALSLIARPGPDGEPVLSVPVTAQEGRFYVGPIDLFGLPAVLPPAPPSGPARSG